MKVSSEIDIVIMVYGVKTILQMTNTVERLALTFIWLVIEQFQQGYLEGGCEKISNARAMFQMA